jgi:anthranilate phosphoribosyltransferase
MKQVLEKLIAFQTLSQEEAKLALKAIAQGEVNASQTTAFMTVFMMRNITVNELSGFKDAMLELCIPVPVSEYNPMDLCGTGGDGKSTFNVSTTVSFVVAGAGVYVAKHGNYGVSSSIGSSNVMEHLGYTFTNNIDVLRRQMEHAKVCILHAPLFHPAMKNVAPIRRELGVKTFFNMLGPMVNPAFVKKQMVGVFSLELARLYGYLYAQSDKRFSIAHSLDTYDEISLTAPFKLITNKGEEIYTPEALGLQTYVHNDIKSGVDVAGSAKIFLDILQGKGTKAQQEVTYANAAAALVCDGKANNMLEGIEMAKESIDSGKAYQAFENIMKYNA